MITRPLLLTLACLIVNTMGPLPWCSAMPELDLKMVPDAPDYSQQSSWLAVPSSATSAVDVFFVYPTVLFNDKDWVMDPEDLELVTAAQNTLATQASVFAGKANIYAPIYRQMNLAGLTLPPSEAAPLQRLVHEDIWRALNYYLQYHNNGRPFFLAGHSQGSMILTDLMLEHWGTTGVEKQLIAALLLGWSLTPADLSTQPAVQMCKQSTQTGCVISYNTMAPGRQTAAPTLKDGALAVNPLSWTMDTSMVPASKNLGAVFFDGEARPTTYQHFTSAQIVAGGLVVKPENRDLVTVVGGHFPQGVYHAFDYSLFYMNLRANIAERIDAFHRQ